jgi:6-phosphogluconolactonase
VTVPDLDALAGRAAQRIADWAREALAARGECALMLTGGSTAGPVYRRLARTEGFARLAMSYYFGDERCVPPSDPESNFRLARENLFPEGLPAGAIVHRMHGEDPDPERAATAYGEILPPSIDILLLGVGPDGHVASLFPGSAALTETSRRVVAVVGPKPPPRRITVTPPVIASARRILVMASGTGKAAVLARALREPPDPVQIPVQLALAGTWMVDRLAGAELG